MIDTIVIKVKYPLFQVTDPNLFTPVLKISSTEKVPEDQRENRKVLTKYIQNGTSQDKLMGIKKPNLTVYRRFDENELIYDLHIQFSIPKMLFGNNLKSLEEYNLDKIITILTQRLKTMGVEIEKENLETAQVVRLHCGINILLPFPRTVSEAINTLSKAELGKSLEINERDYRNGGEALYFYCGSRNFIFYDKIKDMTKTKSKSVDKFRTKEEDELIDSNVLQEKEILRFEVRFNSQKIIKNKLQKINGDTLENLTFKYIFDKNLCNKLVIQSWEEIINRPANQLAFKTDISYEEALTALIAREQKDATGSHSLNRVLHSFGLYALINKFGIKLVRDKLEKVWSKTSCYKRLDCKIRRSSILLDEIPVNELIFFIDKWIRGDDEFVI